MTVSGNVALSAVMLTIFAAALAMAAGYPPQARVMPILVGGAGALLCLIQLWQGIARDRRAAEPHGESDRTAPWREMHLLAWYAGFLLGIVLFGFLLAAPVLVFGFLRIDQHERTLPAAVLAVGCLAALCLVFELVLELPLYRGLAAGLSLG